MTSRGFTNSPTQDNDPDHAGRRPKIKPRTSRPMGSFERPGFATHTGIKPRIPPTTLNATERLVLDVLDDELVPAREVAGFAQISVVVCRRALATLRSLGLADAERHGQRNLWRRA